MVDSERSRRDNWDMRYRRKIVSSPYLYRFSISRRTHHALATDDSVPPPLTEYKGREIAQTMHYLGAPWLTRELRDREEDCKTLLAALKLKPGDTVCDLGCGNGFYSVKIAKLVGERGRVIGVDIQREMLGFLKDQAAEEKIGNIEPVLGTVVDPKLPPGSVDLVLLVDVYHEFDHPEQMLAAIRKSLKPTGPRCAGRVSCRRPKGANQAAAQNDEGSDHEGVSAQRLQVGRRVRQTALAASHVFPARTMRRRPRREWPGFSGLAITDN